MRIMEEVREKQFYDSWRQAERALRKDRDPRMQITLPKVSMQAQAIHEAAEISEEVWNNVR